MPSRPPAESDAPELQAVLTRYIDSRDGYLKAAEEIDHPALADTFRGIAARRQEISRGLATLIEDQGGAPDLEGSPEAKLHRWWIHLRSGASSHETDAVLAECLRGEKDLERTINEVLSEERTLPTHSITLERALREISTTVNELERAVENP